MKVDVLVAEIGSTTTVVNAFMYNPDPAFIGRGVANTTVDTDVREGLDQAVGNLETHVGEPVCFEHMFATSSAAGGLRMTVSGLVYDMTVRAAEEAALNAGGNIRLITAGDLEQEDLKTIKNVKPNIVLVSGGTDYGDRRTAFNNIKKIESLKLDVPIVYAGNKENISRIKDYFEASDQLSQLTITENVYPRVDYMNIQPLRKIIYETFEANITKAKGMYHIKEKIDGPIMPTPGAVMESAMLLSKHLGNLMVIDVGGATTDVHSITDPREEYQAFMEGEPREKRTVEGDLGVFVNVQNVWENLDETAFMEKETIDAGTLQSLKEQYTYMPESDLQKTFVKALSRICVFKALDRHVGNLRKVYTSSGRKVIPEGRDVSRVKHIILTGGALVNLDNTESIIEEYIKTHQSRMMPGTDVKIHKDHDYIFAAAGVLSLKHEVEAMKLLFSSLRMEGFDEISQDDH